MAWTRLLENLQIDDVPAAAGRPSIYTVNEIGLDTRPVIVRLIQDADAGRNLKAQAEEEDLTPLSVETFVGHVQTRRRVLCGRHQRPVGCLSPLPQTRRSRTCVWRLGTGGPRSARIAGRDGALPRTGDVVDGRACWTAGLLVVRHHEQPVTARMAERLR